MLSSIYFEVLVFQWYILFSTGKDDKNWGGHYGVIVSNSVVRVKREVQSAKGDKFEDIELVMKFYLKLSEILLAKNTIQLSELPKAKKTPLYNIFC